MLNNIFVPRVVTVSGITSDCSLLECWKALFPIAVKFFGSVICSNLDVPAAACAKANGRITVNESGIMISSRDAIL